MKFFLDNWYLFLVAAVSGAALAWPSLGRGRSGISANEAVQLINREKAVLVDVCEPAEYAAGHANGARSIPFGSLEGAKELPSNKTLPIVLMCATGARSGRAVSLLQKAGHERVYSLAGGLRAWREANLPVEKSA